MGNKQVGGRKGHRWGRSPQGRRDVSLGRSRLRRAKSDVGNRRLRVTKLSTQQRHSLKNLRRIKPSARIKDLEVYHSTVRDEECDETTRFNVRTSSDDSGHVMQARDSESSFEHLEQPCRGSHEEEECVVRTPKDRLSGRQGHNRLLNNTDTERTRKPDGNHAGFNKRNKSTKGRSFKLRRSISDVNISYREGGTGNYHNGELGGKNDRDNSAQYKTDRPLDRRSPYLTKQDGFILTREDETDAPSRRTVSRPITGHVDTKRKRQVPKSPLSRSAKLRRSVSDVDISYRGKEHTEASKVHTADRQIGNPNNQRRNRIPTCREQLLDEDLEDFGKETNQREPPSKSQHEHRKTRPRGGFRISPTLRRSLSDVDVSYQCSKTDYTSPRLSHERSPSTRNKHPQHPKLKDGAEAKAKECQQKRSSQRHENRKRFGMPSHLRRSISDVDVSYRGKEKETSPTYRKRFLYKAPPVEYANETSEKKLSDENLVIIGSFKAGEDTGRKGRDGRKASEPVGGGADLVTGLADSVKQSLRIPGEEVKEGDATYQDQIPDIIGGWAARTYTDSKDDDYSGFIDSLKGHFSRFSGGESRKRNREEHVFLGSWAEGEDGGQRNNDSGLMHNLKQYLLTSTGINDMRESRGRKGGLSDYPDVLGSWAGGEDTGRNATDESGPLGFLGSLRRSFRTSSGEDSTPHGGGDEPVSPVFTGTFVGGEDAGRNGKSSTASSSLMDYLPSFGFSSEGSGRKGNRTADDYSWLSPGQWWAGEKDQEPRSAKHGDSSSSSWIQNLKNSKWSPWGDGENDKNTEKAQSILDRWKGNDKTRSVFDKWKAKTSQGNDNNKTWQNNEKGCRADEEESILDYIGLSRWLNGPKSSGRRPCDTRGNPQRSRDKNAFFSFFS